jgi:hypothetical protein
VLPYHWAYGTITAHERGLAWWFTSVILDIQEAIRKIQEDQEDSRPVQAKTYQDPISIGLLPQLHG